MNFNHHNDDMKTLVDCINSLKKHGFTHDFQVIDEGLTPLNEEITFKPEEVKILNFYRFEGESDPEDMAVLYAIETDNGYKGTLSDAYGPYADSKVSEFIVKVENISKKGHKSTEDKVRPHFHHA
jgi:hypothetical protein